MCFKWLFIGEWRDNWSWPQSSPHSFFHTLGCCHLMPYWEGKGMSLLLSQGGRGCEVESKALTSGVFTPAAAKRWGWQLLLLLQRWPPDHSPPQTLSTPLYTPNLTASLVAAKVIERRKQMVLEQLVSSCPRETICHPPLCVLHVPKAPSCI